MKAETKLTLSMRIWSVLLRDNRDFETGGFSWGRWDSELTFSSKERWHCERTKTSREKRNESDWPIWAAKLPHTNGKERLPSPKKKKQKWKLRWWYIDILMHLVLWENVGSQQKDFSQRCLKKQFDKTQNGHGYCVLFIYLYLKSTNT